MIELRDLAKLDVLVLVCPVSCTAPTRTGLCEALGSVNRGLAMPREGTPEIRNPEADLVNPRVTDDEVPAKRALIGVKLNRPVLCAVPGPAAKAPPLQAAPSGENATATTNNPSTRPLAENTVADFVVPAMTHLSQPPRVGPRPALLLCTISRGVQGPRRF